MHTRRALARVHRHYAGIIQARRKRRITVTVHLIDAPHLRRHRTAWSASPVSSSPIIRTM
jgi:hypothetical protein